jgi:DNA (cytosine-5)-methyltransferase 1
METLRMSDKPLVLSLFPGIGLLDMAFEQEGFCVVRGPDVLWGGDIRRFHPPAGAFDGVIGGPPCQAFSRLAIMVRHNGYEPKFGNLIPEFERCVAEAQPRWFLMENVPAAPTPVVLGYDIGHYRLNNRWFIDIDGLGAEQNRLRAISWGLRGMDELEALDHQLDFDVALFERPSVATGVTSSDGGGVMRGCSGRHAVLTSTTPVPIKIGGSGQIKTTWRSQPVTAGHGGGGNLPKGYVYSLEDACELQGLPRDFTEHMPFRKDAKLKAVANGVPLPMGRAIARAVRRSMGYEVAA